MDLSQVTDWVGGHGFETAAGAVTVLLTLAVVLATARRMPRPLSGIGAQAVVALGGVMVSVHGLWSFAQHFAGLPALLAVGFIGVFDAAELTLLVMMYRAADPRMGWTPELRLMHRTAWLLVTFSAAMNALDAPSWWARPVLGAIPALAAWLIELKLRARLHNPEQDADAHARPGPMRLLVLGWQHGWAALFAVLGLDAAAAGSDIARGALAQRAARRVYRHRLALEAQQIAKHSSPRRRTRALARVDRRRRAAQRGLDRADVATDAGQSLALARRMAALTGVDGLALLDYGDAEAVMTRLESLAVVPAAQNISASTRAMEAEAARERAEAARQEAEDGAEAARQRADEEDERAEAAQQRAETARQRAEAEEQRAATTREQADDLQRQAEGRAATARQSADAEEQRAAAARQEAERARTAQQAAERRVVELSSDAETARERLKRADGELKNLVQRTDTVRQSQHGTEDELAALRRQVTDLQAARDKASREYNTADQAAREAQSTLTGLRGEVTRLNTALRDQQGAVERAGQARQAAERAAHEAAGTAEQRRAEADEVAGLLGRLRGELAEHAPDGPLPEGGRIFESDAKQGGYKLFRAQTSAGRGEPRAAELAARFGVSEGNARNWLRDFRSVRARELAHPAERTARVNGTPVGV